MKDKQAKNLRNYFSGSILTKGIMFLTVPLYSVLLTPKEYGEVSIFMALLSIGSILIQLNLAGSLRQYILKIGIDVKGYIYSLTIVLIVLDILLVALAWTFKRSFSLLFEINATTYMILLAACSLSIPIQLFEYYLLGYNKSRKYSILSVLRAVVDILFALMLISVINSSGSIARIISILLTYALIAFISVYNLYIYTKNGNNFNYTYVKYAVSFSLPLIVHQVAHIVLAQTDRLMIGKLDGIEEVGLYSMAYSLAMVVQIFILAFNSSWLPIFYDMMKKQLFRAIEKKLLHSVEIVIITAVMATIILDILSPVLLSSRYHSGLDIIPIIISSSVLFHLYLVYANIAFYHHKTWYISFGTLIAGMINIALNYALIPTYGYKIAALTTVISYGVLVIINKITSFIIDEKININARLVLYRLGPYLIWIILFVLIKEMSIIYKYFYEFITSIIILSYIGLKWEKDIA